MTEALINRFRPQTFDEVVGHPKIVKALEHAVKEKTAHAFLFTGESGAGKTTLSRIVAKELGCKPGNIEDVDAATNTGIDDMRAITERLMYKPVSGGVYAVVVDECHGLSKQAWNSLLKILEEPPPWIYWFLCTTEAGRVPKTIQTRCMRLDLKPVAAGVLSDWLFELAKENDLFSIDPDVWERIVDVCADGAGGSPRQALSNLALCLAAKTVKEAEELITTTGESPEAVELARALLKGATWKQVQVLLRGMKDQNPESIRHVVRAYATTVALSAPDAQAGKALEILDPFSQPFPSTDGISPVAMACGKIILS